MSCAVCETKLFNDRTSAVIPAIVISCKYTSMYVCDACIDNYAKDYPHPLPTPLKALFCAGPAERHALRDTSAWVSVHQLLTLHETLKMAHERHKNAIRPPNIES